MFCKEGGEIKSLSSSYCRSNRKILKNIEKILIQILMYETSNTYSLLKREEKNGIDIQKREIQHGILSV